MTLPLEGIRVVEIGALVAAPFTTACLASLGADVIKAEPVDGDRARRNVMPEAPDDISPAFISSNAGKRSIGISLSSAEGQQILLTLVRSADVVVDNFKPGGLAAKGIDAEALCAARPGLIWASISGFGQDGEDAARKAVDPIIQAETGVVSVTGPPGEIGYQAGFHFIDHACGHVVAGKIMAALLRRAKTGQGARITQSLFEIAVNLQASVFAEYLVAGVVPRPNGNANRSAAPADVYATSDGAIMIVAATDGDWVRVCEVLGRPELVADERFAVRLSRITHYREARGRTGEVNPPVRHRLALRRAARGGPGAGRIRDYAEVMASAEVTENGLLCDVVDERGRRYRNIRPIYSDSDLGVSPDRMPGLSEHAAEILAEIGRGDDLADLVGRGIVAAPAGSPG